MIRLRVFTPLPKMLGLAEGYSNVALELPVEPDTNLWSLFSQLSNQYPAFGGLLNSPVSGDLQGVIVVVNNKLIPVSEYHQTLIQDSAEVSLIPPYAGG